MFVLDNATNNDTMVEEVEKRCKARNIPFEARRSRLRCLPHTVHLAAWEVCRFQFNHEKFDSFTC